MSEIHAKDIFLNSIQQIIIICKFSNTQNEFLAAIIIDWLILTNGLRILICINNDASSKSSE